jgi:hypothetical protein
MDAYFYTYACIYIYAQVAALDEKQHEANRNTTTSMHITQTIHWHIYSMLKKKNEGHPCLRLEGFACCDDKALVILHQKKIDDLS